MLFNTIEFVIFFVFVLGVIVTIKNKKFHHLFLAQHELPRYRRTFYHSKFFYLLFQVIHKLPSYCCFETHDQSIHFHNLQLLTELFQYYSGLQHIRDSTLLPAGSTTPPPCSCPAPGKRCPNCCAP